MPISVIPPPVKLKLSKLEIDVDKDWLSKKIYNAVLDMLAASVLRGSFGDNINAAGYLLKGLGSPVDAGDAVRKTDLDSHAGAVTGIHGVGASYVAKTSRSDQWPSWGDIPDKPSVFPPEAHTHPRDDITDLFSSPFWDNIPDKPSVYPPEAHASSHKDGGADEVVGIVKMGTSLPSAGIAGRFFLKTDTLELYYDNGSSWVKVGRLAGLDLDAHASRHNIGGADEIPDLSTLRSDFDTHAGNPSAHHTKTTSRSEITDFWNAPFWGNIPDKPSTFPPENHADRHAPNGVDELKYLLLPIANHSILSSNSITSIGTLTLNQGERIVGRIISGLGTIVFYPDDDLLADITPAYVHSKLTNEPNIRDHDDSTYAYPELFTVPANSEVTLVRYDLGEIKDVYIRGYFNVDSTNFCFRIYISSDGSTYTQLGSDIGPSVVGAEYLEHASSVRYIEIRVCNVTTSDKGFAAGQTSVVIYTLEVFPNYTEGNYVLRKIESTITTEMRVYAIETPIDMKILELIDFKIA